MFIVTEYAALNAFCGNSKAKCGLSSGTARFARKEGRRR